MQTKHLLLSAIIAVTLLVAPNSSSAQFVNGRVYLGPHFAVGFFGGLSLGANIEGAITSPGSVGPGRISLAGRADIAFGYFGSSVLLFSGLANYHYSVAEDKVDLFGGLGISFFSYSYLGTSSIYPAIDLGVRYFISSAMALRFMLGVLYYPYLTFGVDWAL